MKRIIYNLFSLLCISALLFVGCSRDGSEQNFSVKTGFQPIQNLKGEAGYGAAKFKWELPDSLSSLFCIEMVYQDEDTVVREIISKNADSIVIENLSDKEYTFTFTSHGEDGEKKIEDPVTLMILNWQLEPPAKVLNVQKMVAENSLILNWTNPTHKTFHSVVLELYKGTEQIKTVTIAGTSRPEYMFNDLEYFQNDYSLKYYSVSPLGLYSDTVSWNFITAGVAPQVPGIRVDITDFDVAHCADVVWDKTPDMDTVLIKYTDMNKEVREYRFSADRWGYLTLLPGGTVELDVQVKGTNGTWSFPQKQKIKTRLTEETYLPKIPNGSNSKMSKLSEAMYQALGRGTAAEFGQNNNWLTEYSFKEMAEMQDFTCIWEIHRVYEIHLFVNLEILKMGNHGSLTAAQCPTVEEFKTLIDRLPKITEFHVNGGYPIFKKLEAEFSNHPKVKFKKI